MHKLAARINEKCSILLITCLWFLGYYIFGKGDFCKAVSALTLLSLSPLNSLSYCLCLVSIIITLFTPNHLLSHDTTKRTVCLDKDNKTINQHIKRGKTGMAIFTCSCLFVLLLCCGMLHNQEESEQKRKEETKKEGKQF